MLITMYEFRMVEIIGGREKTLYTEPVPYLRNSSLQNYIDDFHTGVEDAFRDVERTRELMETARKLNMFTDIQLEDELRRRRDE